MQQQSRANSTPRSTLTRSTVMLITALMIISVPVYARDQVVDFSIREALNTPDAESRLDRNVRLYFAGEQTPPVGRQFGEFRTNKKTNAFNKSDRDACNWVFLSAILQLQARAVQLGANAVVNIRSNYKNHQFASPRQFQCGAGNVIAGVALIGDIVRVRN